MEVLDHFILRGVNKASSIEIYIDFLFRLPSERPHQISLLFLKILPTKSMHLHGIIIRMIQHLPSFLFNVIYLFIPLKILVGKFVVLLKFHLLLQVVIKDLSVLLFEYFVLYKTIEHLFHNRVDVRIKIKIKNSKIYNLNLKINFFKI